MHQTGFALFSPRRSAYGGAMVNPSSRLARFQSLLLESDSASAVLADWAGSDRPHGHAPLTARKLQGPDRPTTADLRARLDVEEREPIHHRRVCLVATGRVMSVAENWYVPARLSAAMLTELTQGATPFGKVIAELEPRRKTLSIEQLVQMEEIAEGTRPPRWLLLVNALVIDKYGQPLCEVSEAYSRNILK